MEAQQSNPPESTVTYGSSDGGQEVPLVGPYVVVALNSERPSQMPMRIPLAQAHRVNFMRGDRASTARLLVAGERVCQVVIADSTVSAGQGFLAIGEDDRYWLWDNDSRNGTTLNGKSVRTPMRLYDGDLIGIGCTFILFRSCGEVTTALPSEFGAFGRVPVLGCPFSSVNPFVSRLLDRVLTAAESDLDPPFLLSGPAGCGRRTVARAMHDASRCSGEFVEIPAAALLDNLTAIRSALGGTLYVRDLEDLNSESVAALVKALELGELVALDTEPAVMSVRLIASRTTGSRPLSDALLAVFGSHVAELPPLYHRREDIGLLVAWFLASFGASSELRFRRSVSRALMTYTWPGNIEELWTTVRSMLIYNKDNTVELDDLPAEVRAHEAFEKDRRDLIKLLERSQGNISAVALEMGTSRTQVRRLIERFGIDAESFRAAPAVARS